MPLESNFIKGAYLALDLLEEEGIKCKWRVSDFTAYRGTLSVMESQPMAPNEYDQILAKLNANSRVIVMKQDINGWIRAGSHILSPDRIFSFRKSDVSDNVFLQIDLEILNDYSHRKGIIYSNTAMQELAQNYTNSAPKI